MRGRLLPCGETGVLVELAGLDAVLDLDAAVRALLDEGSPPWRTVVDRVPAARTLLLTVGLPRDREPLAAAVEALLPTLPDAPGGAAAPRPDDVVTLGVHYDGPDLADVAAHTRLTEEAVVAAHTGTPWRIGFVGFAPGFAYLVDGDPRLEVPRRTEPRTSVPAGAVGLAGAFSGVYPRPSPGGWQLIGHTDEQLWDADRDPPALLRPGGWVRFVDLGAS